MWYIWANALGDKSHQNNELADTIAIIRTCIVMVYIVTNFFIVANIIHHW